MSKHEELETLFREHGFDTFKWIDPRDIVVARWVRMKCTFGCAYYGKNATCPPNTPDVAACREFFAEYTDGVLFHLPKVLADPEDRHEWTRSVNQALLMVERAVFLAGHEKVFLLFMDNCSLCDECPGERVECINQRAARPSPESMAVDVYSTARNHGYPIQVLSDHAQVMNRYAFLLIE